MHHENGMRGRGLVYILFFVVSSKNALEEPKMNGFISYAVGKTPHVEGSTYISNNIIM